LLTSKFHWNDDAIVTLTELEHDSSRQPTYRNIERWMKWLVADASPGDQLWFSYSGHGGSKRDRTGEEIDGFNGAAHAGSASRVCAHLPAARLLQHEHPHPHPHTPRPAP